MANICTILLVAYPQAAIAQTATASAQPPIQIKLPTIPISQNSPQPSFIPTPPATTRPTVTPQASSSAIPIPSPSLVPVPTVIATSSAIPIPSKTPMPTLTPDEEQMASAAGGLIQETPTPTPTSSPKVIPILQTTKRIEEIIKSQPQIKAIEDVKKSINSIIKAPSESIVRSLSVNPYDNKTLSYNTNVSLIAVAAFFLVLGLAFLKPHISWPSKIWSSRDSNPVPNTIQTNL